VLLTGWPRIIEHLDAAGQLARAYRDDIPIVLNDPIPTTTPGIMRWWFRVLDSRMLVSRR